MSSSATTVETRQCDGVSPFDQNRSGSFQKQQDVAGYPSSFRHVLSYTVSSSSLGSLPGNRDGRGFFKMRAYVSDGDMTSGVVCPRKWLYPGPKLGTRKRSGIGDRINKKSDFGSRWGHCSAMAISFAG